VTSADVVASNGVIHAIDKVVIPPTVDIIGTAVAKGQFGMLAEALTKAGLVEALQGDGPFTVFAPTDAAFAAAQLDKTALLNRADLADILKYHVISGSKIMAADLGAEQTADTLEGSPVIITNQVDEMLDMVNKVVKYADAKVTSADVVASNGVIHAIDKVVFPPTSASSIVTGPGAQLDIVDTAVSADTFTVLTEALTKAGLVDALKGAGPFTVFAPTDDAFAAALEALKIDKAALLNRADLADILKNHVISGAKVMAADLKASQTVDTLNGVPVTITKAANNVMFAGAKVTAADVAASNGVIHVINKVVIPPSDAGNIPSTTTAPKTVKKTSSAIVQEKIAKIMTGSMKAKVTLPQGQTIQQYVSDAKVQMGYKMGIANHLQCDKSWVTKLTLSVAPAGSRRLATSTSLDSGSVKVHYEITVPKEEVAKGKADTLAKAVEDAGKRRSAKAILASKITDAVSSSTGTTYEPVEVKEVTAATFAAVAPVTKTKTPAKSVTEPPEAASGCKTTTVLSAIILLIGITTCN
jgi:uncharacterized surface protein with fasciclin (FAS1) repeats